MGGPRASEREKAYWRDLAEANARLAPEFPPPESMEEVFEQMARIRRRLGRLSEPGLPPDDERAIAENAAFRRRLLRKGPRGA
jgi:hypothetical protein